jgi:hypothetical protein
VGDGTAVGAGVLLAIGLGVVVAAGARLGTADRGAEGSDPGSAPADRAGPAANAIAPTTATARTAAARAAERVDRMELRKRDMTVSVPFVVRTPWCAESVRPIAGLTRYEVTGGRFLHRNRPNRLD